MNPLSNQIKYRPLTRVAPSHFYAMVQCPYKIILAEAFDRRPLIPLSPNAYIGSVFHRLMEKIVKGQISEETFNEAWEREIKSKEEELRQEGITFCIPLKNHVTNIGLKKILIRNQIKANQNTFVNKNKSIEYLSEKWLQNEEGTVGGMVDLITKSVNSASISDFKTGKLVYSMVDESGEIVSLVKEEYEYQLKLYAQLYFISYKVYPDHLYLIDMNKSSIEVRFTHKECLHLYEQAIGLLKKVNANIMEGSFSMLANCSTPNCKYCLYRPACDFYHVWLPSSQSTNDVYGVLTGMRKFLNGNININVQTNGCNITISGFNSFFEELFDKNKNKVIGLYGLKKNNENNFSVNSYSCIKKQGDILYANAN
jgi:CRISPR/Cas system-associated exonuclease Cas4 (RecB family)